MSKQWGHGFNAGERSGVELGEASGRAITGYDLAQQMRVILCSLITAHKKDDFCAFWASVEIAKTTLSQYANFSDEDWRLFRGDERT